MNKTELNRIKFNVPVTNLKFIGYAQEVNTRFAALF